MKKPQLRPYLRAGLTAFLVILISTAAFFMMAQIGEVKEQLKLIGHILRPISMGLIFAFLLLPVYNSIHRFFSGLFKKFLEKKYVKPLIKALSIFLSLVFAFVILYILLAMVIPQVYYSIVGLIQAIPEYINTAQTWILNFLDDNPEIQELFMSYFNPAALTFEEWLDTEVLPSLASLPAAFEWIKINILPNITGVLTNVSALVLQIVMAAKDVFIGIIVSVYLLASKDTFAAQSKKIVYSLLPTRYGDLLVEETRNCYRIMSGFINGKLLDSLIIGIITLVCCNLFNFPYAALVAMIIGVTNIIPFFGPFIGAIPSAFLILLVDPMKCIYFCIFVFILQQFDGNILGPKILGESTGLASFWVLFSILLFGGLFGFTGMVLGVPTFAIIYSVAKRLVERGLRKKNMPTETEDYMGLTGRFSEAVREEEPGTELPSEKNLPTE